MTIVKWIVWLATILPAIIHADADIADQTNSTIPKQIRVPDGHAAFLTAHAKGDQIYQCTVNNNQYFWEIQAPDAQLLDDNNRVIGKHYAGPVWEYKEGSRIQGKIVTKIDISPGSSISWLLIEVVNHKGNSLFAKSSFINRINTQGGLSPSIGCDTNHLGMEKRVNYSADYVFYQRN